MKSLEDRIHEARDPCEWPASKLAMDLEMRMQTGNILVEGTSDEKSFKKYFNTHKVRFFPDKQNGNSKVRAKGKIKLVFEELRKKGSLPVSHYFSISDRDYDCMINNNLQKKFTPNWFYVDSHSLETMILNNDDNFQKLIDHAKVNWIDSDKLKILEQKKLNLKEIVFNIAKDIGVLRLISLRHKGLNISFNEAFRKSSNFSKFLSPEKVLNKKIPFDKRNFFNFLFDKNNHFLQGTTLDKKNAYSIYEKETIYRKSNSMHLLAHGHDLCKILHFFFTHKILSGPQDQVLKYEKNFDPKEGDGNSVELKVQSLMNEQFFKDSNLYQNIKSSAYYAESLMV